MFGVAPIYKCEKSYCVARTQSHLIEVIGGIQTVKAQHFELLLDGNGKTATRDMLTRGLKLQHLGATSGRLVFKSSERFTCSLGWWLVLRGRIHAGTINRI